jgi:hypothetical protein
VIFAALTEDEPDALRTAFADLPRSARSATKTGAARIVSLLERNDHPRAAAWIREIIAGRS